MACWLQLLAQQKSHLLLLASQKDTSAAVIDDWHFLVMVSPAKTSKTRKQSINFRTERPRYGDPIVTIVCDLDAAIGRIWTVLIGGISNHALDSIRREDGLVAGCPILDGTRLAIFRRVAFQRIGGRSKTATLRDGTNLEGEAGGCRIF